ncbi:CHAT domain-containing protein [Vararia minispora EC-137]|uniref:CHAT domain-containing protein n=1 Tax=Vararia minispora EC-137 TaxID=1314806 RepID=A0ACB8QK88_9AGAM|nr:CHAT domain-containing protein [Vararia minispora EC-137]
MLAQRYQQSRAKDDLAGAVSALRQAAAISPDDHVILNNLGIALILRYERFEELQDLEDGITVGRTALHLTPIDDPARAMRYYNLGTAIESRFDRMGRLEDLSNAISMFRHAVELTPNDHPNLANRLAGLGSALQNRFSRHGQRSDLEEAIAIKRQAIREAYRDDPKLPEFIYRLGSALEESFRNFGDSQNIDEAISLFRLSIELTGKDDLSVTSRFHGLGVALQLRYERSGNDIDLQNAILADSLAYNSTSDDEPRKARYAHCLGVSLKGRFTRFGDVGDLSSAVSLHRRAAELTPEGHPDKAMYFNGLWSVLQCRWERLRDTRDLKDAITVARRALEMIPDDHPSKAHYAYFLGVSLQHLFGQSHLQKDVEEAVKMHRLAVDLTPDGSTSMAMRIESLGNALQLRSTHLEELKDLDDAITLQQRALDLTAEADIERPIRFSNLGQSYSIRFSRTKDLHDIDTAISMYEHAVDLTPEGHALLAGRCQGLANSLCAAVQKSLDPSDFTAAFDNYMRAATNASASFYTRISAALGCVHLCSYFLHLSLPYYFLRSHTTFIELIPRAISAENSFRQRLQRMVEIGDTVNTVVKRITQFGVLELAIEWLETGRSVLWADYSQLRPPVDGLRSQHPEVADRLERAAATLERRGWTSGPRTGQLDPDDQSSLPFGASVADEAMQYSLAAEYEKVLEEVRALEGFQNFLRPKRFADLAPAAKDGPVVVINIHDESDAIVLCPGGHLVHVPLPSLTYQLVETMRSDLLDLLRRCGVHARDSTRASRTVWKQKDIRNRFCRILELLWVHAVQPLYHLTTDRMPHLTWCPTGWLAMLPLHAAGIYKGDEHIAVSDFVVSSYTPNLSSLIVAASNNNTATPPSNFSILTVSQSQTVGHFPLPGAAEETAKIRDYFPNGTALADDAATIDTVLEAMRHHDAVHLACHGVQDVEDPSQSAFILHDGRLALSRLVAKSMRGADFAFLSACQTATGVENIPDEAVHLAAGMLAVGYRSVIGTMWSIGDRDAPIVADVFYASLKKLREEEPEAMKGRSTVAYALHDAVQFLQERVEEDRFLEWVPFVHFGF